MKILLVSQTYPPYPASGSQRVGNVAAAFRAAGHTVDVVAERLPGEPPGRRQEPGGFPVHTVRSIPHPTEVYIWMKRLASRKGSSDAASAFTDGEPVLPPRSRFRRFLLSLVLAPDRYQGFVLPAVVAGYRLAMNGVDAVYTSSPPVSSHLCGLLLKGLAGRPWIAEYRDPWMVDDASLKPASLRTPSSDAIERALYRQCLEGADRLVGVTNGIVETLGNAMRVRDARRLCVARNGIPRLVDRAPSAPGDVLRIVHLGNLYAGRDAMPFFEALTFLEQSGRVKAAELEATFFGSIRDDQLARFNRHLGESSLRDRVRFVPWVPFEEGQRALDACDLLLLFAQKQPLQVPSKIYEYLGQRKPILAFVDQDGESAAILGRAGGHYLVAEHDSIARRDEIVAAALTGQARPGWDPDRAGDYLEELGTARQMQRVVHMTERLVEDAR